MRVKPGIRKHCAVVGVFAALVLLVKVGFIAAASIRSLAVTPYLIDDSFIFMQIANNLAKGKGFSFDGVSPTAGAPPAWIVITSINHLLGNRVWAAKATVIESAFFGATSALLVFAVSWKLFGLPSAYLNILMASLTAPAFFQAMNGMETFLFVFIGLLALNIYLSIGQSLRSWVGLGLILGSMSLIRVDGILLGMCVGLWEVLLGARQRSLSDLGRGLLILALVLALAAPLAAWSYYTTGSVLVPNQLGRYYLAHGFWQEYSLLKWLELGIKHIWKIATLYDISLGSFAVAIIAALWGAARLIKQYRSRMVPFWGYIAVHYALLAFYQWYFPDVHGLRYIALPSMILIIPIGRFVLDVGERVTDATLDRSGQSSRVLDFVRGTGSGSAIVATVLLLWLLTSSLYQYVGMIDGLETRLWLLGAPPDAVASSWCETDWIAANTPKDGIIAAKDFGRLAYFSARRIVDLVGIVDPSVIPYIKRKAVDDYLAKRQVDYLIIPINDPNHYLNQSIDLALDRYVPVETNCQDGHSVYQVLRLP